ncbi:MAG: hypothetical protein QOG64_2398, partial [Acidimicrobiaceae bacterium]|nr:hypothetical protein [Acidimicrobiaceae bacterium]
IAYFNKPVAGTAPGDPPTTYAMSAPTFVPDRAEIWYLDGNSGFWALRFTNGVWPFSAAAAPGAPAAAPAVAGASTRPATGTLPATGGSAPFLAGGAALLSLALVLRRMAGSRAGRERGSV